MILVIIKTFEMVLDTLVILSFCEIVSELLIVNRVDIVLLFQGFCISIL